MAAPDIDRPRQPTPPSMSLSIIAVAFSALAATTLAASPTGCAMSAPIVTEQLATDQYRLKCRTPLPECLQQAENLCRGNRYTVLSAADEHDYLGPQGSVGQTEVRASEAVVRCGSRGGSLWGRSAGGPAPTPSAKSADVVSTAPAVPPPRVCVPGATQPCVGPAACQGGQSCATDGSGFSACDCGKAAPPAAAGGTGEGREPAVHPTVSPPPAPP